VTDHDAFVSARRERWNRLERLLRSGPAGAAEWSELAALYRSTCSDLSRAQALAIGDDVRHYLDELAGRAHNRLYGPREVGGLRLVEILGRDFPREVRRSWRAFLAATVLFYGPMIAGATGAYADPGFASMVLPPQFLEGMEAAYSSADLTRGSGEDALMAGFYVNNNVGIAFRCFATGVFAGLGSIFFLVYNGLVLGTVKGHLLAAGYGGNLLAFVSGHGPWELTGIVVSGAAGLKMGWALIDTGGRTRLGSLRAAGPALFALILGAAAMIAMAAAIEAFWSAGPVPHAGKYAFGVLQVGIVTAWLALGGRRGGG
jgi:uncharacterized membrane protein SpoIIM required for sporulation